jgi:hypothetical protein
MKHAGPVALDALEELISAIRVKGAKETSRGVFYRKGKAWLHFHEDKAGLFADVRIDADWQRFRVTDLVERATFLVFLDQNL